MEEERGEEHMEGDEEGSVCSTEGFQGVAVGIGG